MEDDFIVIAYKLSDMMILQLTSHAILLVVHFCFDTFYSYVVNPCFRTFLVSLSLLPLDFYRNFFNY